MAERGAVVITGANGGIGATLCATFRAAGYFVVATDRHEAAQLREHDAYQAGDLARFAADPATRADLLDRLRRACAGHGLRVLVNNAAVQRLGPFGALSAEDWRVTLDVNVMAPALLAQGLLPQLEAAGGVVVNISSIHARLTKPAFAAYATSKAALSGLTRAMAVDLGGRVRVNAIAPAAIDTPMLAAGFEHDPAAYAQLAQSHPAGRIGLPGEVAAAALFLASADCAFMTGAVLELDGGIGHRLHDPA